MATTSSLHLQPRLDSKLDWGECNDPVINATLPADCANFTVPLDYLSEGGEEIQLQLARIRAPVQPAKGTILLNFGGPGEEARATLTGPKAIQYLALSGGRYDLAAFDPRGVANTIPQKCFLTKQDKIEFLEAQTWHDQNETSLEKMWDRAKIDVEKCYEAHNKTQPFLGTASVARDIMSVVDALGEDGMLRYWGFSYGTTLGATVAAMFPDKIDKMVIDGVQNPHEYYHALADYEEWTDSDRVFSEIFRSCVRAGPQQCPMAAGNYTAEEMEMIAWRVANALKTNPIQLGNGTEFDYPVIRGLFGLSLYGPDRWPLLMKILPYLATNETDHPVFVKAASALVNQFTASVDTIPAVYGIHCSDRIPRLETLDEFRPVQARLSEISKVMDGSAALSMACGLWKSDAKERYMGDFQVKTKNPILLSSNRYDGHTPLKSAYNVSSSFEGSSVLVVNGFGHSTMSQASVCNLKQTSAYWLNGTLPEKGFQCEVNAVPYGNYTWQNAIAEVYGDGFGSPGGSNAQPQPVPGGGNDNGNGSDNEANPKPTLPPVSRATSLISKINLVPALAVALVWIL